MSSGARGFTLIEMVVVLALVAILSLAAQPLLELSVQRTQEFALRDALRTLRGALDAHKQAADSGRIRKGADASGYPASLDELVQGVPVAMAGEVAEGALDDGADTPPPARASDTEARDKRLYFLRRLPRDPFADASLPAAQTWGLRSYDSAPDAPAPGRDVFDVHSRSERTALDGSAYRDW